MNLRSSVELPQLLTTVTPGADGIALTVKCCTTGINRTYAICPYRSVLFIIVTAADVVKVNVALVAPRDICPGCFLH